jgi:hypothetical protein
MSIAVLLLNLLPGFLAAIPGLSAGLKQVIGDVTASAAAVISSGAVSSPSANTFLAAWLGIITALKADPSLPAGTLNAVSELEKAVQAALLNDAVASKVVDWSTIVTMATV